ncbi:transglycosylase SLT domain-containing protein [Amycolatopsis sp. NPDC004772]
MSDLSFNVIALDRASKTFLSAAESIDRMVAKLDKLDGKTATATVNIKTDESTKALDSFTNRFTLMAAGIAAASPLAGAAILAGLGGSLIAVAATAQASNEKVRQTYKTLWSNVVQDTKSATNVLVPQLVASGNQIGHTFEALQPQMQQAFKAAGPDLQELTTGLTGFATNVMPGVTSAVGSSYPVFEGLRHAAEDLGTATGTSLASMGQNSVAYGAAIQSFGQITGTVITLAITLVNDLAQVWASSGQEISGAISSVAGVASGLASGALPILSAGLNAAARILTVVADVVEPIAPLLGTVGTAALATWAAFKLSGLVTAGVNALAAGILNMGVAAQTGATKATAAGIAVQGLGNRAATAAVGTAAVAESLAGPVGIAVAAATLGFGLLATGMGDSSDSAQRLAGSMEGVVGALQASNGQVNASVISSIQADGGFKKVAESARAFGITQNDLTGAITAGGGAYDNLAAKIQKVIDANHRYTTVAGGSRVDSGLNETGEAAQQLLNDLNELVGKFKDQKTVADQSTNSLKQHAIELTHTQDGLNAANAASFQFGISQRDVIAGLENVAAASGDASVGLGDVAAKFAQATLASANAAGAIEKTFQQADQQVTQARLSVASAAHGLEAASRSVADAQHGETTAARALAQAQQGVADAQRGVMTAQRSLLDAQRQERDAQLAINEARQQAIRDLKALHQQLDDQFTSEASARVRLFDAQQALKELDVKESDARGLAAGPVTADNETKVKAAIDLLSAQNGLNAALQNGANLREDVAKADRAGVEGSKGVQAAQQQLASAQRQVSDASYGVEQAQKAVTRAQQGVADASYAQQRAHQAVADAQYQQRQASQQLTTAQQGLNDAVANASRSLDISTEAGRRNLGQLFSLADAIKNQFGPTAAGYNSLIQTTADKFGITTQQAQGLLDKLGLIPKDFKFGMTAVASASFEELNRIYDDKFGGHIGAVSLTAARAMATGGHVSGPGGPRDDQIPAWLSNGEWVQPADSVSYYGHGFMEAVRQKKFPRFASGGLARGLATNYILSGAGVAYQGGVYALEAMGFKAPARLAKYEPPTYTARGGASIIPTGQHLALIDAALAADGIPRSDWARWEAGMNVLIQRESGWNANSVNLWDSNAKRGTPSGGLTQTIGPTFAANRNPSLPNNMFDPVANIAASINYIRRRYGDISNVQQANPNLPPRGYAAGGPVRIPRPRAYDNGGALPPGMSTVWNGTGRPENVRTANAEDKLLDAVNGLRSSLEKFANRPMTGTLRTREGAFLGEVEMALSRLEHAAGI